MLICLIEEGNGHTIENLLLNNSRCKDYNNFFLLLQVRDEKLIVTVSKYIVLQLTIPQFD